MPSFQAITTLYLFREGKRDSHLKFTFQEISKEVVCCLVQTNVKRTPLCGWPCSPQHVKDVVVDQAAVEARAISLKRWCELGNIRRGEPTALLPHTHPQPHKEVPGQQRRITRGGVDNGTSCPAQKGYGQLRPSNGIHTCTFAFLFLKKKLLILGDRGHCFGVAYANPFAFAFLPPSSSPPTKTTAMLAGSPTVLNALARALSLYCVIRFVPSAPPSHIHNTTYPIIFASRHG